MNLNQNIIISDETLTAISEKKPVVALWKNTGSGLAI